MDVGTLKNAKDTAAAETFEAWVQGRVRAPALGRFLGS